MTTLDERSYRALLAVPGLARVLIAMFAGRTAGAMLSIALVLFALTEYSAQVAGVAAALSLVPGLVTAPLIGALLDRWGRTRLIRIDYVVTSMSLVLISVLSLASSLPTAPFLAIVAVFGLTQMFSDAGVRALLPGLVPATLWERVNAADSTGYLVAWIVGPPVAATIVAAAGGETAFLATAAVYATAAVVLSSIAERHADGDRGVTSLLVQALNGIRYVWGNKTLRGLGISVAVTNLSFGAGLILVPVIIVDRLTAPEPIVGISFTVSGVAGVASAIFFGRLDTRGREWPMLLFAMAGIGLAALLLLPSARADSVSVGVAWALVSMACLGVSTGLWDISLFTLRQRRTDPVLLGRAFAISMALNQAGVPIGAALAGWMASRSVEGAVAGSACAGLLGAVLAGLLVPRRSDEGGVNRVWGALRGL
jgi:MFS family permease